MDREQVGPLDLQEHLDPQEHLVNQEHQELQVKTEHLALAD